MQTSVYSLIGLLILLVSCEVPVSRSETTNPVVQAQQESDYQVQIMFYNVENLFDTIDNPSTRDEEFTPDSKKKWGTERYQTKLDRLVQVIQSIDSAGDVAAIGLAEVENGDVLVDLVNHPQMLHGKWGIIHQQSPDFRGIDVALLFDSAYYTPGDAEFIQVALPDPKRTTREILKVTGSLKGGTEMSFYVNHWPSRYGGQEASEPGRIAAAKRLKKSVARTQKKNPDGHILIMGDFNDYPNNQSMSEELGAGWGSTFELQNLMADSTFSDSIGSYNYRGEWGFLDQIILNSSLAGQVDTVYAHRRPYMMYFNKKYQNHAPSRTYSRDTYYGGYSDHLPVVVRLSIKQ